MCRSVPSFRIHAEPYIILNSLYYDFLSVMILEDISKSVSLSDHRKDSQEVHDLGYQRLVEHVRPCSEYGRVLECSENHKGVHKGVAMIRCQYDRTILWNVFLSMDFHLTVTVLEVPVDDRLQQCIAQIVLIDLFSAHLSLRLLLFFHVISMQMQASGRK